MTRVVPPLLHRAQVSPAGTRLLLVALATLYAHMSRKLVSAGPVDRGQVIGFVGCTGSCETPHIHFEIRQNGVRVDQLGYL
ncbi:hypothetical protein BH23ACT12_BH23ACT12_06270 [soil metagenome]